MRFTGLDHLLQAGAGHLKTGPLALIFVEDEIELASTLRHHLSLGFGTVVALMPQAFALPDDPGAEVVRVDCDTTSEGALATALNRIIRGVPTGTWIYYGWNAEYLFYHFCEDRGVGEMLAFHTEERRQAMLAYVIDLYAEDLGATPYAVSRETAHLDRTGYYALARKDAQGLSQERQLDFYGGLRWRFEEHIPTDRRRIDRISIFQTQPGLITQGDYRFNIEEYNTYACPWHHNITAAICSFRTAKALKLNPGSTFDIDTFKWHNSMPFEWSSRQLLDLGLIEPGQWF